MVKDYVYQGPVYNMDNEELSDADYVETAAESESIAWRNILDKLRDRYKQVVSIDRDKVMDKDSLHNNWFNQSF